MIQIILIVMVQAIPYLTVPNAKKAIEVYKDLFGATLVDRMPYDKEIGMQMGLPEDYDWANSTMHSEIEINGGKINMADGQTNPGGNVEVLLMLESKEHIESIWAKVKKKEYDIKMELEVQFWGAMYGRFVDEFGIGWQLNLNMPQ